MMSRRKIGTSVHAIAVHLLADYRDKYEYRPDQCPVASQAFGGSVSLLIYLAMTDTDVDDVVEAVTDIVAGTSR